MNICHLPPKSSGRQGVETKTAVILSTDLVSVCGRVAAAVWGPSGEGKKLLKTFLAGEPWLVGLLG